MISTTKIPQIDLITDHLKSLGYTIHEPGDDGGWPFAYHENRPRFFYTIRRPIFSLVSCFNVGEPTSEQRTKIEEWCKDRNGQFSIAKYAFKKIHNGVDAVEARVTHPFGYDKVNFERLLMCLEHELTIDDFPSVKD